MTGPSTAAATTDPAMPGGVVSRSELAPPTGLVVDGRAGVHAPDERLVPTALSRTPVLGWKHPSSADNAEIVGFEVQLDDDAGQAVWRSGVVGSAEAEVLLGCELEPFARYDWRVRVVNGEGRWSPWAHSAVETGPFEYSDWQARWLAVPHLARVLTPFHVVSAVRRARLHLTGQGVVRAWVGDTVVNPDRLDPSRTDIGRALYRTYDVTELLTEGHSSLDFVVGMGEWARTGESPRLLAELVMWHDDGSVTRVSPGEGSAVAASEIEYDVPFYLERHDPDGAFAANDHPAPKLLEPVARPASPETPPLRITADPTPPLRTVRAFAPVELTRSGDSRVFDVGENIAGRTRIIIQRGVPRGTVVRVLHGEHIGQDGHIDTTNLTMPFDDGRERQLVEYVSTGEAAQVCEPWFTYYGFRYLEVRGVPAEASIAVTASSMHTDLHPSGTLRTDSPTIDRLLSMAERTLLNNVHGVPEDCPTREQAAWTGDTASVAEYELAAFDSAAFIDKWIADLETSQQQDGQLPAVSPDLHVSRMPSDPVWGSALHRLLHGHLLHYGDPRLVRRALPALRRWADFQLGCIDEDGIISRSPISYGHDWLALEQTPPPVHHTGAVIDCLLTLADLEDAVGEPDAANVDRRTAEGLREAARRMFYDPASGTFANGSQGSYAVAIEAGILTGDEARHAGDCLVDLVRRRGNRVSSGFATTRSVVRALTRLGRSQVVYDILRQEEEPGIGAMLNSGPGTFWECWWIDPTNTGTGSLNHVGLGGPFAAWAWEGLAGLKPTAPGYSRFRIEPQLIDAVTRLELRTQTVRGEVTISYASTGSSVRFEINVPPGSEGTLVLPGREDALLTPGRHVATVSKPIPAEGVTTPAPEGITSDGAGSELVAADILGSRTLLQASRVAPGRAAPIIETLQRLRCMPVPHEQPAHPVRRIIATTTTESDPAPTVILTPPAPIPVTGITFFYALIDQCMAGPDRIATPFLLLRLSNGGVRSSRCALWPAGWNRVAVDTADLDPALEVVEMEVGLAYGSDVFDNALALYPSRPDIRSGFHLSDVGFSRAVRTW